MVKRNRLGAALLYAAVYAVAAGHGECSNDLLHDSGFDLWCGDELCSWQVEKGAVAKAPTWHESDLGVELVGDEVVMSQLTDAANAPCVLFDLVADIDLDAGVVLEMDLYDDGEVDYSQRLPTASWENLSFLVAMPERFDGIRFRLSKTGSGRAVLAQIRARSESVCDGPRLPQPVAPLGAGCWASGEDLVVDDEACASGTCAVGGPLSAVCSGCAEDADCGDGQVCGVESRVESFLSPYRTCVPAASRGLGERCAGDGECATGVCCQWTCSDCCAEDGRLCGDGADCVSAGGDGWVAPAAQCDPGGGSRASGAACLTDADCASARCAGEGPLRVCGADGRLCEANADCPPDGTQDGDEFGTCAAIGVTRGTCD
jgi:hypothetical protein